MFQDGHDIPGGGRAVPLHPGRALAPALKPPHAVLPIPGQTHRPPAQEQYGVSPALPSTELFNVIWVHRSCLMMFLLHMVTVDSSLMYHCRESTMSVRQKVADAEPQFGLYFR